MATVVPPVSDFEMARVFGRTFEVIGRNWLLYLALSVVLVGLPTLILQLLMPAPGTPEEITKMFGSAGGLRQYFTILGLGLLINTLFGYFLQATLVRATIEDLSGRRPSFADCLRTGLAMMLPILGLAVVSFFGIFFASFLLIVPGIMLAVAWSVAIPAKVAERIGVFASLSRSRALTKGHRWKIFFLVVLTAIITSIIQGTLGGVLTAFGATASAFAAGVAAAIASAVMATLVATMYLELRTIKDGTDVGTLADVFS